MLCPLYADERSPKLFHLALDANSMLLCATLCSQIDFLITYVSLYHASAAAAFFSDPLDPFLPHISRISEDHLS